MKMVAFPTHNSTQGIINTHLFAEEKCELISYYATCKCALLQTMSFRFSEIPLLVSPVVCHITNDSKVKFIQGIC